jgi:glutathione S-transferase
VSLRLFYSPGACSLVAHIALEESGASFEAVRVPIADGAHHKPEYLAVNPRGLIPALEVDGEVVTENVAILALIARRFPEAKLFPKEDLGFARVLERSGFFATSVHVGAFRPLFIARRAGQPWAQAEEDDLLGYFREIEALLEPGPWLLRERYSAADGYPLTFRRWGWRLGFDMAQYPRWTAHTAAMLERPAVARALDREGLAASEF